MSEKLSKKQAKKLKKINASIRKGVYVDWVDRFIDMLEDLVCSGETTQAEEGDLK